MRGAISSRWSCSNCDIRNEPVFMSPPIKKRAPPSAAPGIDKELLCSRFLSNVVRWTSVSFCSPDGAWTLMMSTVTRLAQFLHVPLESFGTAVLRCFPIDVDEVHACTVLCSSSHEAWTVLCSSSHDAWTVLCSSSQLGATCSSRHHGG